MRSYTGVFGSHSAHRNIQLRYSEKTAIQISGNLYFTSYKKLRFLHQEWQNYLCGFCTKLLLDDGHIWNSLVAIIITLAIELHWCHINSWHCRSWVSTHFTIDLLSHTSAEITCLQKEKQPEQYSAKSRCRALTGTHICHEFCKLPNC